MHGQKPLDWPELRRKEKTKYEHRRGINQEEIPRRNRDDNNNSRHMSLDRDREKKRRNVAKVEEFKEEFKVEEFEISKEIYGKTEHTEKEKKKNNEVCKENI